jgi:hypothetical protein
MFALLFSRYELILTKSWFGYILGDFFTNSSGHPGGNHSSWLASSRQVCQAQDLCLADLARVTRSGLPDFAG